MSVSITAQVRDLKKYTKAHQYRQQGLVPGVIYSRGEGSMPLLFDPKELQKLFKSHEKVFDLKIEGHGDEIASVIDVQKDPLKGSLIHVELHKLRKDEKSTLTIPILCVGIPKSTKEGGILVQSLREVDIECLPKDAPEKIEINVENLELNGFIRLEDVTPPAGVTFLKNDLDKEIVAVRPPKKEKEEAPATVVEGEEGAAAPDAAAAAGAEKPAADKKAAEKKSDKK